MYIYAYTYYTHAYVKSYNSADVKEIWDLNHFSVYSTKDKKKKRKAWISQEGNSL